MLWVAVLQWHASDLGRVLCCIRPGIRVDRSAVEGVGRCVAIASEAEHPLSIQGGLQSDSFRHASLIFPLAELMIPGIAMIPAELTNPSYPGQITTSSDSVDGAGSIRLCASALQTALRLNCLPIRTSNWVRSCSHYQSFVVVSFF